MERAGNSESSPNHSLWLWVPDQRSAPGNATRCQELRLSGTTTEIWCPHLIYDGICNGAGKRALTNPRVT
ncbi:hypothetical protein ABIA00_004389 [Bradyrhizobium ottawaense]